MGRAWERRPCWRGRLRRRTPQPWGLPRDRTTGRSSACRWARYFSSLTRADQSEDAALGVNGGQRILAARDLVGAVKDRATAGTRRVRRPVDVADPDVEGPRSLGHLRHPRHDGADHGLALVEEAVGAEVAHIHVALLPPAEVPGVEGDRPILVACLQLVPADVLRTVDGDDAALRTRATAASTSGTPR